MTERHDDLVALITAAEKAAGTRGGKVMQEWHGSVAVRLDGDAEHVAQQLATQTNKRWQITDIAHGNGWVSFRAVYTAKGANANDADKFIRKAVETPMSSLSAADEPVAVNTNRVTPVAPAA